MNPIKNGNRSLRYFFTSLKSHRSFVNLDPDPHREKHLDLNALLKRCKLKSDLGSLPSILSCNFCLATLNSGAR